MPGFLYAFCVVQTPRSGGAVIKIDGTRLTLEETYRGVRHLSDLAWNSRVDTGPPGRCRPIRPTVAAELLAPRARPDSAGRYVREASPEYLATASSDAGGRKFRYVNA